MRDLLISKWLWLLFGVGTYFFAGSVAAAPIVAIAVAYTIAYDVLKAAKEPRA